MQSVRRGKIGRRRERRETIVIILSSQFSSRDAVKREPCVSVQRIVPMTRMYGEGSCKRRRSAPRERERPIRPRKMKEMTIDRKVVLARDDRRYNLLSTGNR
jgi:hypothetical protein